MSTEVVVEPQLGERIHAFGVVLRGGMNEALWLSFLHKVAEAIGMSAVAQPAVWHYPLNGKGGVGVTMVLPITESFLALDTWPDHRGAYLLVCSCKNFFSQDLDRVAREFGLTPSVDSDGRFRNQLNLG